MSRELSKIKEAELLSPAGSFDALRAAVNAGCDAVYMGGLKFGARAFAENGDTDTILRALDFVHLRGKKLFLTVNTLFKQNEIDEELIGYLKPYYDNGLDAVIVQDTGAMQLISEAFPDLQIHASTQASLMTAEGAERFKKLYGITRFVPGRELSVDELLHMRENTDLEIEVFVHGALCYCYSGQCLLSSMIGGRSGNRGRCAQPCRKLYVSNNGVTSSNGYFLSPKDMCTVDILADILDTGVDSLKIEGRMKSPEYVGCVTESYRYLIDYYNEHGSEAYRESAKSGNFTEIHKRLSAVYNRGGFNTGYFIDYNGLNMMSVKRPNHYGVKVGEVLEIKKPGAVKLLLNEGLEPGDTLELRADDTSVNLEFTVAKDGKSAAGSNINLNVKNPGGLSKGSTLYRLRDNALLNEMNRKYLDSDSTVPVDIFFTAAERRRAVLEMSLSSDSTYTVTAMSDALIESALKAPATKDSVIKQLSKLGRTSFRLNNAEINLLGNVFLPNDVLNSMRQAAAEKLEKLILDQCHRNISDSMPDNQLISAKNYNPYSEPGCAYVETKESGKYLSPLIKKLKVPEGIMLSVNTTLQVDAAFEIAECDKEVRSICLNLTDLNNENGFIDGLYRRAVEKNISLYLGLPFVCRLEVYEKLKGLLTSLAEKSINPGLVIRNNEELAIINDLMERDFEFDILYDYNMYHMNSHSDMHLAGAFTIPVELNRPEISRMLDASVMPGGMIVYGYQPVMLSAQCVFKNTNRNKCRPLTERTDSTKLKYVSLTDETGHTSRGVQFCDFCMNIIYNSDVLDIREDLPDSLRAKFAFERYDFTFESPEEMKKILSGQRLSGVSYTHGHIKRGVD